MMSALVLVALTMSPAQYKDKLVNESILILGTKQECTVNGYNTLYSNFSIINMIDDSFDRATAIEMLRERCNGMKSKWEEK